MKSVKSPKFGEAYRESKAADTTGTDDYTSNTTKDIIISETTTTTTTTKTTKNYLVDSFTLEEFEMLKKKVLALESKLEAKQNNSDEIKHAKMKEISTKIISEKQIPSGRFLAFNYDGDLVANENTMIDLLTKISPIDQDDIFIWKSGTDYVFDG